MDVFTQRWKLSKDKMGSNGKKEEFGDSLLAGWVKMLLTQSCATLWDPMYYSPPCSSVHGFSRLEYWSGLLFPPPGDLPKPGVEPLFPVSPTLAADSSPLSHWGSPCHWTVVKYDKNRVLYYVTLTTLKKWKRIMWKCKHDGTHWKYLYRRRDYTNHAEFLKVVK